MKEFEKKPTPNREPASSEGMKGLSKFLPMTESNYRRRLTEYEVQVQDLQAYVRSLEAETVRLRKKAEEAPKETMVLENKLREANRQLVQSFNQNEKLVNALYEAREQIASLREEVDKLCAPPSTYGVFLSPNEDATVNILAQGQTVFWRDITFGGNQFTDALQKAYSLNFEQAESLKKGEPVAGQTAQSIQPVLTGVSEDDSSPQVKP